MKTDTYDNSMPNLRCAQRHGLAAFLSAALLAAASAIARPVSEEEAGKAAERWLRLHPQPLASHIASGAVKGTRTVKDADGTALFHVVRMEGGGVVVTSAETGITPVIAFLDADDLVESDDNPLWFILRKDLARRGTAVAALRAA
ncbi:MAG: Spi family protease inhibitor, partial [Kiritimatiellae bacterium]|nr:Spi family protease inhibitor [Kiritimatiellia bacterium]